MARCLSAQSWIPGSSTTKSCELCRLDSRTARRAHQEQNTVSPVLRIEHHNLSTRKSCGLFYRVVRIGVAYCGLKDFWVAADHRGYEWAQAGGVSSVNVAGMWWAAVPRDRWAFPAGQNPGQSPEWHERFEDRSQQIVFIGQEMDEPALRARLDACLLSPELSNSDSAAWAELPNPFPAFNPPAVSA